MLLKSLEFFGKEENFNIKNSITVYMLSALEIVRRKNDAPLLRIFNMRFFVFQVQASHFEGLITTIVGYVLLAVSLIVCHVSFLK